MATQAREETQALRSRVLTSRRWLPIFLIGGGALFAPLVLSGWVTSLEPEAVSTHRITRGDLLVTVTEKGTVESSKNTEIKCQIRGGYGGRGGQSIVTWVIPAGTVVDKDDELIRFDTKVIEETISLGKTDTNIARAELVQTETDAANAKVAVDAYTQGQFLTQMKSLQGQLKTAERNRRASRKMHERSRALFRRGYATELEVASNAATMRHAELELGICQTEIDVLSRLTRKMELETRNSQLLAVQARLAGRQAGVALEEGRLKLALEELDRCVIKAPKAGLVIYPSAAKWKEAPDVTAGASVHNDQVLLLMPDLSRMQVKIGIHESVIDRVKPGQRTRVSVPKGVLEAEVFSVAEVARQAGWWDGNVVKYDTVIRLPAGQGLLPGMTAEVEVVIARHEDVLSVPTNAVLETETGTFCWVKTESGTERRSLQLGDGDDSFIVVNEGLRQGDDVILDPLTSLREARQLVAVDLVHVVKREDLVVSMTEQGALESANNKQIKCKVRGNSTINWVIENGTQVKPGDVLVELENKQIEDFLHERTKYAFLSKDASIGFRAEATRKGLAIQEYLEGRYPTDLMKLEKAQAIAEANLNAAKSKLAHTREMLRNEFANALDVDQAEFAVRDAEADLKIKATEIEVLKKYTRAEELVTLRGEWEAAKAAARGHEEVLAMDEQRMALAEKEMEHCTIKADRAALVIYPSTARWKGTPDITEGATVHNDQVLLLMPDLTQMQVKVGIHETMIDQIKPGISAKVTLPGKTLSGKVSWVASTAQPASWWTGNIVKYDAIVDLPESDGLKPGMSAEVEIFMNRYQDVLTIPMTAVVARDNDHYCWVGTPDQAERRKVQLGESNEMSVIVESGIEAGDQVVLNPALFFEDANVIPSR